MCFDPCCPCASLYILITLFLKFRDLKEEWVVYEEHLEKASALISTVDSARKRLSSTHIAGGWESIDRDIRKAKLALERARKLVQWRDETRSGTGRRKGRMKFFLMHEAATANMGLLRQYME